MSLSDVDYLLTEADAAKILGVRVTTLRYWRWARIGPDYAKLDNGNVRYRREDLSAYIVSRLMSERVGDEKSSSFPVVSKRDEKKSTED